MAIVDNSNAQTRRLRQYMDAELNSGIYEFRASRWAAVCSPASTPSFEFEPASMLKILHATYAMDQCACGTNLANNITIRDTCNNDECPDPAQPCNTGVEDLDVAIREMMEQSDSNRTMEIELRMVHQPQQLRRLAGPLSGTHINHRLGCLCGQPFNTFTCVDACNLYELIADGSLFGQTWQDTLYELMSNGTGNTSSLAAIINTAGRVHRPHRERDRGLQEPGGMGRPRAVHIRAAARTGVPRAGGSSCPSKSCSWVSTSSCPANTPPQRLSTAVPAAQSRRSPTP